MFCNQLCFPFQSQSNQQNNGNVSRAPFQVRLIDMLGLSHILIDKFLFNRKPTKYYLRSCSQRNQMYLPHPYTPPQGYTYRVEILSYNLLTKRKNSVPVLILQPINRPQKCATVIYSHGNSSDLSDALTFISKMATKRICQWVIYDYTGYGESLLQQIDEQTIVADLELILAWLNRDLSNVMLWGFSLGTYPTVVAASRHPVGKVFLMSPIASVCCFFEQPKRGSRYDTDFFASKDCIANVKGSIMIMHSLNDQVIPISHSRLLLSTFRSVNPSPISIELIEISDLKHNAMHKFFVSSQQNELQSIFLEFFDNQPHNAPQEHPYSRNNSPKAHSIACSMPPSSSNNPIKVNTPTPLPLLRSIVELAKLKLYDINEFSELVIDYSSQSSQRTPSILKNCAENCCF